MTSTVTEADTYVACLTPPGSGAIACLALFGPQAWNTLRELFRARSPTGGLLPSQPEIGKIWLGLLGDVGKDEVVVVAKRDLPWPLVEVQCHGGREVVRMLKEQFEARGAIDCTWQAFELLTAEDVICAHAAVALANAITGRTAAILLDQEQGALTAAFERLFGCWREGNSQEADRILGALNRWTNLGRHLNSPWRIAVCGAPNVGKSSLVNALAGFERCIVNEIPGTTRDVVTTLIAVDGWPVELADTAGLREGAGTLETQGMDLARQAALQADLCLWVMDASGPPVWPDFSLEQSLVVINKTDLAATWDIGAAAGALHVSARTGAGLPELCQALAQALVPLAPALGDAVPFTARLCFAVEEASRLHATGKEEMAKQLLQAAWDDPGATKASG